MLITGGTGSFAHHFVSALMERHAPRRVVIYSRDEFKQFEMAQEFNAPVMRYFIGDVRDAPRLSEAMRDIDIVVHAAALKQVPAAEYNPTECIKTNIHGAENVIAAALANNVRRVIALSTDKAANPINLYGATKLCSDKLFVAANNIAGDRSTRFSVVRYGNVVGTRGSVVPHFRKLIAGGTTQIPITHEAMTRFWISPQQGVDFVLRCFMRMSGGEIYVPRLPSVRIVDVARALAPHLPIKITGVRPGEKLHEVLCPEGDAHLTYRFADHFVIRPAIQFSRPVDYRRNACDESGMPVELGFEYASGTNPHFLSVDEIFRFDACMTA